ncbi:HNH endonuclease signature motif containing protein [Actinotalea ferrariae]|uniref:HNH endonuclease signature motif containing protein n=1 Tax=Actinotalea ferrariae TaxID=1386098 RepID=UPI0035ABFA52
MWPCARCGRPITLAMKWDVGHILDRALGGSDDLTNTRPEHSRCNQAAGGQRGAAITNARRAATNPRALPPARDRGIRGI